MKVIALISLILISACTTQEDAVNNYGQPTANNLAEMVLDKNDLMVGKTSGSDVSRSSLAVTKYRSGAALSTGAAE